jgi:hypothetical protein
MEHRHSEIAGRVDCGPEGCELDWLTSARLEVDDDPAAFQRLATDAGWGDGLPLIPPTEERVRAHLVASGRFPDECLAELPPRNGRCNGREARGQRGDGWCRARSDAAAVRGGRGDGGSRFQPVRAEHDDIVRCPGCS